MSESKTFFYDNADALAVSLADSIAKDLDASDQPFLILPGGSSPVKLMHALACENLDWNNIKITTTDERCVPFEDAHSNAGQVQRLFAAQGVEIEPFWLHGTDKTNALPWPATVTVLGMGLDGHFASLFPGAEWPEGGKIIKAAAPAHPRERLSLSFETLLASARLILLVPDEEKAKLCQSALAGEHPDMPIARLCKRASAHLEIHAVDLAA